jgi:hypothetical protein
VLDEGLATLLDVAHDREAEVMASREILREAFEIGTYELTPDGYGLYERSAHFVSFLFAQYGRDNYFGASVWFELTGEITDGSRAMVTNCGNCWEGAAVLLSSRHPIDAANPQPGLNPHVLTLYRDLDATGELGIVLRF